MREPEEERLKVLSSRSPLTISSITVASSQLGGVPPTVELG
jgi:hypothetical protein